MPPADPVRMRLAVLIVALVPWACSRAGPSPAPPAPPPVRITPGTLQYSVTERRHVEQQFQNQAIVSDSRTQTALTVTIDSAADGFRLAATVDSATVDGDGGIPVAAARAAAGTTLHGSLSPNGTLTTLAEPERDNPLVDQLALSLYELLPRLPTEGAQPNAVWDDTMRISGRTAGIPITLDVRSQHRTEPWTDVDGVRVLPVATRSEYDLAAEGDRGGQWIVLAGRGISHALRLLAESGAVVLGVRADTLHIEIELPATGLHIPLTQTRSDTVRRVIQ